MRGTFSGKIQCGICGCICQADTWYLGSVGKRVKTKVWNCKAPRKSCGLQRVMDAEVRKAAESYFGEGYEPKFVEEVQSVIANNETREFIFKDGRVEIWQRGRQRFRLP